MDSNNKLEPKSIKNLSYLDNLNSSDTAVVLFHGYGASMSDLYGLSQYIPEKLDWYFPNGPIPVALGFMMEGRAWFPIDMRELEAAIASGSHRAFEDKAPEEFKRSQEMALEFLQELRPKYKKLIIGGFSQGAMLASHTFGQAQADGLALFSGTLIDKASLVEKLKSSSPISFMQCHGKSDPVLGFDQAKNLFELLEENNMSGDFLEFQGAHEIPQSALEKFASYIQKTKA